MNNMKMSILDKRDIFYVDNLIYSNSCNDLFKNTILCSPSDFAIVNGAFYNNFVYASGKRNLKNRTTSYFLQNSYSGYNYCINCDGGSIWTSHNDSSIGIRPVILFDNIPNFLVDRVISGKENDFLFFGEYPNSICNPFLSTILDSLYRCKSLTVTGRSYTCFMNDSYVKLPEYLYNGNRYVRCKVNPFNGIFARLSNGFIYTSGSYAWIRVEPVKWFTYFDNNKLISCDVVLSGIMFDSKEFYDGNFDNTLMCGFLNSYLINDMIYQSRDYDNVLSKCKIKKK